MALKKVLQSGAAAAGSVAGASDAAQWPLLWEYLTASQYPDGSKRETATVIIVGGPEGWRGCVSDRDNARTMWKVSMTLEGLLLSLEEGLAEDDPRAWRASQAKPGRGKK